MRKIIDHLRSALIRQDGAGLTDGQLLSSFAQTRDEAAFVGLVRRHGRMVLGVCRRLLRNEHDAEDAFQATFLVLARKAGSVEPREAVGNWLYGVAYRTALEARAVNARRRGKERPLYEMAQRSTGFRELVELREVLDRALSRLPDKYRLPMVLCELEGRARREVARQLGVPEGTLSSRLAAGRKLLAKRLARYGAEFSSVGVAAALAESAASALPPGLAGFTAKAALMVTAGLAALPAPILILAQGVDKAMLISKLKLAVASAVIAAAVIGVGAGGYGLSAGGQGEAVGQSQTKTEGAQPAKSPRQQVDQSEARLQVELKAAEEEAARATDVVRLLRARLSDLQRQREEDAAVLGNRQALNALARRFRYLVPVEIGVSDSNKGGGKLEILEVWGTRPKIEVGGQYLVRGKYVLPEDGTLYFYETATTSVGAVATNLDLQYVHLPKGQGEFTLLHGMVGPGFFHLNLTARDRYSVSFANVYFGTGDNVLRKKPW
jgi:RNA polymerase sigma factor (sigma-70 family)